VNETVKQKFFQVLIDAMDPIPCIRVPIDPLTQTTFPACSVVLPRVRRSQISHDHWYRVDADFEVTVMVAQTSGYDEALDDQVDRVLTGLMADPELDLVLESMSEITEERAYTSGGETNVAAARLTFNARWSERFVLALPDRRIDTAHLTIEPVVDGEIATPMVLPLTNLDTTPPVPLEEITNTDHQPGIDQPADHVPAE
jgi:hypothetical protein